MIVLTSAEKSFKDELSTNNIKYYGVKFFEDLHPIQNGMVKNVQFDADEAFKFSGELIVFETSRHKPALASADLGEHSIEILQNAGLDHDFIELLKKEQVVIYPEKMNDQLSLIWVAEYM